jgi:hypothetical protein
MTDATMQQLEMMRSGCERSVARLEQKLTAKRVALQAVTDSIEWRKRNPDSYPKWHLSEDGREIVFEKEKPQ